jgi:hypothetical protein
MQADSFRSASVSAASAAAASAVCTASECSPTPQLCSRPGRGRRHTRDYTIPCIPNEMNRIPLVLFDMSNRIFGAYLAAMHGDLNSVMHPYARPAHQGARILSIRNLWNAALKASSTCQASTDAIAPHTADMHARAVCLAPIHRLRKQSLCVLQANKPTNAPGKSSPSSELLREQALAYAAIACAYAAAPSVCLPESHSRSAFATSASAALHHVGASDSRPSAARADRRAERQTQREVRPRRRVGLQAQRCARG